MNPESGDSGEGRDQPEGRRHKGPAHKHHLSRREFLLRAGGVTAAAVAVAAGADAAERWWWPFGATGHQVAPPGRRRTAAVSRATYDPLGDGLEVATAGWVKAENARPGTTNWLVGGQQAPHDIEGFASVVSAVPGDKVTLFVNTAASSFHVEAYRMGWYQGLGGRLVWVSPETPGVRQPAASFISATNTVECHWSPSMSFDVTQAWPTGTYLLKLVGSGGEQQYVPLTVRDDSSQAAYVIQNSVTTWQAYNLWGNYSLYYGPSPGGGGQTYSTRSRMVSFDRPYPLDWGNGSADFLGNEYPLVMLAEKLGLDVAYWTDVDLHQSANLLLAHKALLSLGHDEYWSPAMRAGATAARDAGVNLAFLGANACYRRIRFDASPVGPNRHQICYKVASEDPLYGVDNAVVTANWPDPPDANPESSLIGDMYQSNPVNASLVVADASSWLFRGTGAQNGDSIPNTVGSEYDGYDPNAPTPSNIQLLAHSPVRARGVPGFSDVSWYSAPSGAGVFASGTNWWISKLSNAPLLPAILLPGPFPAAVTNEVTEMTGNLMAVIGSGPAARSYPSTPNWQSFYGQGGASTNSSSSSAA